MTPALRLSLPALAKAAAQVFSSHPERLAKLAGFFASQFPSAAAAMDAYQASRAQQAAEQAQREYQAFPALNATQPQMWLAQQQMQGMSDLPVVRHHHRRHHHG